MSPRDERSWLMSIAVSPSVPWITGSVIDRPSYVSSIPPVIVFETVGALIAIAPFSPVPRPSRAPRPDGRPRTYTYLIAADHDPRGVRMKRFPGSGRNRLPHPAKFS